MVGVIEAMAESELRRGLFMVLSRLVMTSVAVTGAPLEKTMFGRMCSVTVEELLETVQLWATPPLMAYCPGAVTDW